MSRSNFEDEGCWYSTVKVASVILVAALIGVMLQSCAEEPPDVITPYFSTAVTNVVLEVAYVGEAKPFLVTGPQQVVEWGLAKKNVEALFDGKKTVVVPKQYDDLHIIPSTAVTFTKEDLLVIADRHRPHARSAGDTASIFIIIFAGGFAEGSIAGQNFDNEGVVALSQDAVRSFYQTSSVLFQIQPFQLEQILVTHELGHAFGLVNWGLPMQQDHDADGAHCTNPNCVMNLDYLHDIDETTPVPTETIFGDLCLEDARNGLQ